MNECESEDEDDDIGKHGQWIRRRRLDGALNRVPIRFYGQVWQTLEKVKNCSFISYVLKITWPKLNIRKKFKLKLMSVSLERL